MTHLSFFTILYERRCIVLRVDLHTRFTEPQTARCFTTFADTLTPPDGTLLAPSEKLRRPFAPLEIFPPPSLSFSPWVFLSSHGGSRLHSALSRPPFPLLLSPLARSPALSLSFDGKEGKEEGLLDLSLPLHLAISVFLLTRPSSSYAILGIHPLSSP